MHKVFAVMAGNPVPDSICQVQPPPMFGEEVNDAQAVQLMLKGVESLFLHHCGDDLLPCMPERGVPEVMAHADRPGKLRIEGEPATDG